MRFFATRPLRNEGPNSGREKLTGLNLAHFSAFYRRAWRANDFMWGRLDAATRIVDLMVSSTRNVQLMHNDETQTNERLANLAAELVPTGNSHEAKEHRQLVKEALDDAKLEWRRRHDRDSLSPEERKALDDRPADELQDDVARVAAENDQNLGDETALRDLLLKAFDADLKDPEARRVLHPRRLRPRRALRDPAPGAAAARRGHRAGWEARLLHEAAPP